MICMHPATPQHILTQTARTLSWQSPRTSAQVNTHLDEPNLFGIDAEALSADIDAVLPDQSVGVAAHAAAYRVI